MLWPCRRRNYVAEPEWKYASFVQSRLWRLKPFGGMSISHVLPYSAERRIGFDYAIAFPDRDPSRAPSKRLKELLIMEHKLQQYDDYIYTCEHLSCRELECSAVSRSNAINNRRIRIELLSHGSGRAYSKRNALRGEGGNEASISARKPVALACITAGSTRLQALHFRYDSCDGLLLLAAISIRRRCDAISCVADSCGEQSIYIQRSISDSVWLFHSVASDLSANIFEVGEPPCEPEPSIFRKAIHEPLPYILVNRM
jgi:hypothetical protein